MWLKGSIPTVSGRSVRFIIFRAPGRSKVWRLNESGTVSLVLRCEGDERGWERWCADIADLKLEELGVNP